MICSRGESIIFHLWRKAEKICMCTEVSSAEKMMCTISSFPFSPKMICESTPILSSLNQYGVFCSHMIVSFIVEAKRKRSLVKASFCYIDHYPSTVHRVLTTLSAFDKLQGLTQHILSKIIYTHSCGYILTPPLCTDSRLLAIQ